MEDINTQPLHKWSIGTGIVTVFACIIGLVLVSKLIDQIRWRLNRNPKWRKFWDRFWGLPPPFFGYPS
jgi:hypothetical protein